MQDNNQFKKGVRMIRAIRDIRFYLLLCLPLAWYSCCQMLFSVCAAQKIVIKADPLFSTCFSKEVENNLNPHDFPKKIAQHVMRLWPTIESISVRLSANKTNTLYLSATSLLCRINEQSVLLANGHIVPAIYYDEKTLQKIPRIKIQTYKNERSLPRLQNLISKLDYTVFDSFVVSYYHPNWVQFAPKETDYFSIVCTDGQSLDQKTIHQCLQLKNNLEKKGKLHAGNHWIADVRFENQIIVYTKLRGAQHG